MHTTSLLPLDKNVSKDREDLHHEAVTTRRLHNVRAPASTFGTALSGRTCFRHDLARMHAPSPRLRREASACRLSPSRAFIGHLATHPGQLKLINLELLGRGRSPTARSWAFPHLMPAGQLAAMKS